jgi:hypothetical protein
MKTKFFTLPSLAELIHHSLSHTFALPEILPFAPQIFPYPLALTFPFFFSFFFFFTSLINKTIKIFETSKKYRFN